MTTETIFYEYLPNINIPKFKATVQEVYRELVLISSKKFYALIVDRRKLYEDYV